MKRALLLLFLTALVACAPKETAPATTSGKVVDAALVCPISGAKIDDKSKADCADYNGKRYYFCCPSCKPEFEREPKKYADNFPPKSKPGMKM